MTVPPFARWLWRLVRDVWAQFQEDHGGDVAAGTTFWLLVSIPAGILAMVSALGWLGDLLGADLHAEAKADVVELAGQILSEESSVVIDAIADLFERPQPGLLTTSVGLAIFSLSRGFAGLIRALDTAYDVEDRRSWVHQRLLAVGLSVASLVTIAATVAMQLALADLLDRGWPGEVLRWALALSVLVLWAATVYHLAPFHRTPWRYDLPGAVLAAAVWVAVSAGYELYVRYAGGGNEVLGAIGGVVLALTWLYAIVLVLVVGAELNAVLARRSGVVQPRRTLRSLLHAADGSFG